MEEIEKIQRDGRRTSPAAFVSTEGANYSITYYVPIQEALNELEATSERQKILDTDPPSGEKEENIAFLHENKEFSPASDVFDLSPNALSHLDNNRYRISYYIKLRDYYLEKQEYEQKSYKSQQGKNEASEEKSDPLLFYSQETPQLSASALSELDGRKYRMSYYIDMENYNKKLSEYNEKMMRHQAGDRKAFEEKTDPAIFYSGESSSLSSSALSEMDGKKHRMSYYVELENYNKKLSEYNEKMIRHQTGDKEAFDEKMDPLIFYSREGVDLSAGGLSELDGKKYKMSYYHKLREYQQEREEYEKKLLLYKSGQADIFEKPPEQIITHDAYSLSAEALSNLDGKKYKLSYYEKLKNYHDEIQDYNKKLARHNAGYKDAFDEKTDPLIFYSKESADLSAKALSEVDGRKYKMSYYIKLKDYYKELEEYELNKLLSEGGYDTDDEEKKSSVPTDFVNIDFREEKSRSEKIWTPKFEDMMAALKGRLVPYFMENLFETMKKVDGEFTKKFASPLMKIYLDFSTEIVNEENLLPEETPPAARS